jgi:hypothetical protein
MGARARAPDGPHIRHDLHVQQDPERPRPHRGGNTIPPRHGNPPPRRWPHDRHTTASEIQHLGHNQSSHHLNRCIDCMDHPPIETRNLTRAVLARK